MIARVWRGWTRQDDASAYEQVFASSVLPHLQTIDGYHGAYLMRRDDHDEVEFVAITLFGSMDAIRAFTGDDHEAAVVSPEARRALTRFGGHVTHYTVVTSPKLADTSDPSPVTGATSP
jgi:heme-degrading monooxygenase HmoA